MKALLMNVPVRGDVWKTLAVIAITALLSMAATVVTVAKDTPTREQISEMIQTESPYIRDQNLVRQIAEDVREVRVQVTELTAEVAELRGAK